MIAQSDIGLTQPEWALGYRWDIVLRGRYGTVFEGEEDPVSSSERDAACWRGGSAGRR